MILLPNTDNRIGGVMLASSGVDRGFETWSGQAKDIAEKLLTKSADMSFHGMVQGSSNNATLQYQKYTNLVHSLFVIGVDVIKSSKCKCTEKLLEFLMHSSRDSIATGPTCQFIPVKLDT
jgi:hypothetical protein